MNRGRLYRKTKSLATPKWADRDAIKAIYDKSRQMTQETGINYRVDHVIPVLHPAVCGLHVHNNLQIITAQENSAKGARCAHAGPGRKFIVPFTMAEITTFVQNCLIEYQPLARKYAARCPEHKHPGVGVTPETAKHRLFQLMSWRARAIERGGRYKANA